MPTLWPKLFLSDAKMWGKGKVWGLEPDPVEHGCMNCGDRGVLVAFYADGGPLKYPSSDTKKPSHYIPEGGGWFTGEMRTMDCPVCRGGEKQRWFIELSNLSGADTQITMSDYRSLPGKTEARQVAIDLLAQGTYPVGFATFWGEYGTGKTMLLKALTNGFRLQGVPASYWRMSDLLASVRDEFGSDAQGAAERLIDHYKFVRVLAVDEIDRVNLTPWARETMHRLFDTRYERAAEQLTVFATNASPRALDGDFAYLASRMSQGIVTQLTGSDVRPIISKNHGQN